MGLLDLNEVNFENNFKTHIEQCVKNFIFSYYQPIGSNRSFVGIYSDFICKDDDFIFKHEYNDIMDSIVLFQRIGTAYEYGEVKKFKWEIIITDSASYSSRYKNIKPLVYRQPADRYSVESLEYNHNINMEFIIKYINGIA